MTSRIIATELPDGRKVGVRTNGVTVLFGRDGAKGETGGKGETGAKGDKADYEQSLTEIQKMR